MVNNISYSIDHGETFSMDIVDLLLSICIDIDMYRYRYCIRKRLRNGPYCVGAPIYRPLPGEKEMTMTNFIPP
jgi:hypothetical protein